MVYYAMSGIRLPCVPTVHHNSQSHSPFFDRRTSSATPVLSLSSKKLPPSRKIVAASFSNDSDASSSTANQLETPDIVSEDSKALYEIPESSTMANGKSKRMLGKQEENAEPVRFRRRSSKRRARQRGEGVNGGAASRTTKDPPKKWEDMSMGEKAMELYVGEKGALYWLNKFAYASIFIVIGGWIVFRFVGPALNLYQLDAPPLPPSAMFKGEE
ncbi:hypothetical protein LINPERPRIM_LOCUS20164 [Linum perenne]